MKRYYFKLLSILSFLIIITCANLSFAGPGKPFSHIVFFGDSLTDNGNLYNGLFGFIPKSPPYSGGRFANGPVWSEYVADFYGLEHKVTSVNYAVGGQTAILHDPFKGFLPYTITMSLYNYYYFHTYFSDQSKNLFIIWIGANDYLHDITNMQELTNDVVGNIKFVVERLISYGGKNIMVINLPDISKSPYAAINGVKEQLHAATLMHNKKLAYVIGELQNSYKSANIQLLDANYFFNDFLINPEAYNRKYGSHIKNFADSCFRGGYTRKEMITNEEMITRQIESHLQKRSRTLTSDGRNSNKLDTADLAHYIATNPGLLETYRVSESAAKGVKPCAQPDDYMFWDKLHPTTALHKMMFQHSLEFMKEHFKTK